MDWLSIALGVTSALGASGTFLYWRDNRGVIRQQQLKEHVEHTMKPLSENVAAISQRTDHLENQLTATVEASVTRSLQPVREDIAVLKNQVEVFWRQVGLDMAKVLHQPDPARAEVDALLEELMEDTLSPEGELELRRWLVKIRNWEPGKDIGIPVQPGEQTAAAILLRAMPHIVTERSPGEEHDES